MASGCVGGGGEGADEGGGVHLGEEFGEAAGEFGFVCGFFGEAAEGIEDGLDLALPAVEVFGGDVVDFVGFGGGGGLVEGGGLAAWAGAGGRRG